MSARKLRTTQRPRKKCVCHSGRYPFVNYLSVNDLVGFDLVVELPVSYVWVLGSFRFLIGHILQLGHVLQLVQRLRDSYLAVFL